MSADVRRVEDGQGSHIDPPLDPTWSDLAKLEWKAAVTQYDTGITVKVNEGGYSLRVGGKWVKQPGYYTIQVGASAGGPHTFEGAWSFMNGVDSGATQAPRAKAES